MGESLLHEEVLPFNKEQLSIVHLNVQCLNNKTDMLNLFLKDYPFEILCFSEHWLTEECLRMTNITGYTMIASFCRKSRKHGGVCIFARNTIMYYKIDLSSFCTELDIELCGIEITPPKTLIVTVYRSCHGNFTQFIEQFEKFLTEKYKLYSTIIILGDFNINFTGNSQQLSEIQSVLSSFDLSVKIKQNTRISKNSASCIDNIISNAPINETFCGIVDPCLSDHFAQYIFINKQSKQNKNKTSIKKRLITSEAISNIRLSLKNMDWSFVYNNNNDVNNTSEYLLKILKDLTENHIPEKTYFKTNECVNWFDSGLRKLRGTLQAVKAKFNETRDSHMFEEYKKIKYKYRSQIKLKKKLAYQKYLSNPTNLTKKAWKIIKTENNTQKSVKISTFSAHEFNTYFTTIAPNILKDIESVKENFADYLKPLKKCSHSFFLEPTTPHEVTGIIKSMKNSSAYDIYGLNIIIIKQIADLIVEPLSEIINCIFSSGIFPDDLKISKVIPLQKNSNDLSIGNHRPISIVPTIGKIIEKAISKRLAHHLKKHNIINETQFGYQPNKSTTEAVMTLIERIVEGFERDENTTLSLCDLSKAFDCVSYNILLEKLDFYGIRGIALSLFESYLSNRQQCVFYKESYSGFIQTKCGVPQGSVLGPYLFVLYINDLPSALHNNCVLFADDTTLNASSRESSDSWLKLDRLEETCTNWFHCNKLKINKNKNQRIQFSKNRSHAVGNAVTLLGIRVDDSLSWKGHIDNLINKLSSNIFLLKRLSSILPPDQLKMAYYGCFHANLNYGVLLWGNSTNALKIFKLQKKAIRILCRADSRDHCKPLFKLLKIMPLPSLYIYNCAVHIHKHKENFIKFSDIHTHYTRHSNHIRPMRYEKELHKRNSVDVNIYNKLPNSHKNLNNYCFKIKLKEVILKHCFYSLNEFFETAIE